MNFLRKGRGQPKALLLAWLSSWLLVLPSWGQQSVALAAPGQVSETQLRYFLSRALTLQGAVEISGTERRQVLPWAGRLGTRFAGRVGGFWEVPRSDAQEQAWYDSTRLAVRLLRAAQPEIVVQGAIFEVVQAQVSNLTVPNSIRAEFGEDTLHPAHRRFSLAAMMYPGYFTARDSAHYRWDDRPPGEAPGVPDMSRPETQMWFYFCARRQLDAGCEALHFGQVTLMDDRDPGHRAWWTMLTRVRQYARQRNRGFVLCDAHTHASFYDPDPQRPLPDSTRQLLFDFHASPMRPFEADTLRHGQHGTYLDYARWEEAGSALYKLSAGGRTPSGWHCARLPALVELDNGGSAIPYKPGQWPWTWGLDEISWFANQPAAYRNEWLVYAAARVPQLDPDVYPEFPAMRIVRVPGQPDRNYRADLEGQGPTLSRIWRGKTAEQGRRLLLIGPPAPPAGSLLVGPHLPD